MSDRPETATETDEDWVWSSTDEAAARTASEQHARQYLESQGLEGHIVDLSVVGGLPFSTCLLLRTTGRKTGKTRIRPLIYGDTGGEVFIVASAAGADSHPAWYLNLVAGGEVAFQIGGQAFRATWREPQGTDRDETWAFLDKHFPPYADYRGRTAREIPIVALKATEEIERFTA